MLTMKWNMVRSGKQEISLSQWHPRMKSCSFPEKGKLFLGCRKGCGWQTEEHERQWAMRVTATDEKVRYRLCLSHAVSGSAALRLCTKDMFGRKERSHLLEHLTHPIGRRKRSLRVGQSLVCLRAALMTCQWTPAQWNQFLSDKKIRKWVLLHLLVQTVVLFT